MKKQKEISICRSETWLDDDFKSICDILDETVEDFIDSSETIINIQVVKDDSGLSRFWIYTVKPTPTKEER